MDCVNACSTTCNSAFSPHQLQLLALAPSHAQSPATANSCSLLATKCHPIHFPASPFTASLLLDPPFPCTNTIVPSLRNAMLQTSRRIRREYLLLQRHRNYNSKQKMDGICLLRSSPPRLAFRVIERPIPLLLNESTLRPAWTILQWGSELESPVFSFCFLRNLGSALHTAYLLLLLACAS